MSYKITNYDVWQNRLFLYSMDDFNELFKRLKQSNRKLVHEYVFVNGIPYSSITGKYPFY